MEYIFSGHEQLICLAEDSSTLAKGITSGAAKQIINLYILYIQFIYKENMHFNMAMAIFI